MIEYKYEIDKENNYSKFNYFEISDELEPILADDYYLYNSKDYKKNEYVNTLYKNNFLDKYDRETQSEIYQLYIDNKSFKEKVLFIYSIIDANKYKDRCPDPYKNHYRVDMMNLRG